MAPSLAELPGTDLMTLRIETGDALPVRCRPHRHTPEDPREIAKQVEELLKNGLVEEDDGPYSSPVLLVNKGSGHKVFWTKSENRRLCVDFINMNKVKKNHKLAISLKTLPQIIDTLAENHPKKCLRAWI